MPLAVAEGLRKRGGDITTSQEANLLGAGDDEQIAFARSEDRVVITRDQDFLSANQRGVEHAGIVFWTQRQRTIGQLIRALDTLSLGHLPQQVKGRVFYL
ncbi:MAG: DUF5615 family PIN-like protein [Pirellulales bacterium]